MNSGKGYARNMKTSPFRCVLDSSVLIDLYRGEVLRVFLARPGEFIAPDFIVAEMTEPSSNRLLELGLRRGELSGDELNEITALLASHPAVSVPDLSALVLARRERTMLLTGDGSLRRLAEEMQVEVHGTLWALDWMVEAGSLTPREAADALRAMLGWGSRLPDGECRARLRRWEKQP